MIAGIVLAMTVACGSDEAQPGDSPADAVVSTVAAADSPEAAPASTQTPASAPESDPAAEPTIAKSSGSAPDPSDEMDSMDDPAPTMEAAPEPGDAASPEPTLGPISGSDDGALSGLGPGLHDFTLPNAQGGPAVQLSSYIGQKNVVLVFYRAFW